MSFQLRCHNCSSWLGEAREPMKFRGCVESPKDREYVAGPRDTWRCKGCGWSNIFGPFTEAEARKAAIEMKRSA